MTTTIERTERRMPAPARSRRRSSEGRYAMLFLLPRSTDWNLLSPPVQVAVSSGYDQTGAVPDAYSTTLKVNQPPTC